jgi:hypothetical protein
VGVGGGVPTGSGVCEVTDVWVGEVGPEHAAESRRSTTIAPPRRVEFMMLPSVGTLDE